MICKRKTKKIAQGKSSGKILRHSIDLTFSKMIRQLVFMINGYTHLNSVQFSEFQLTLIYEYSTKLTFPVVINFFKGIFRRTIGFV